MKSIIQYLVLAVTILHLTACSYHKHGARLDPATFQARTETTIFSQQQTHAILHYWQEHNYRTDQAVTFVNKHPSLTRSLRTSIGTKQRKKAYFKCVSCVDVAKFRSKTPGIGLPVVLQTHETKFTHITPSAYDAHIHPAVLVAESKPSGGVKLTLLDPRESKSYAGQKLSLQEGLVIDYLTKLPENKRLDFKGLFKPQVQKNTQGFYFVRPYDKKRIPIIMIHGIWSTPETFMDMAEAIEMQPDLYKRYQIWHYYYPTGIPWLVTADDFRKQFRQLIQKLDPDRNDANIRKTVIIAHSMGGLISRVSCSEPGTALTDAYLGKSKLADITDKASQKKLKQYFEYKPLTEPRTIIFCATPHKGSSLAKGVFAWTVNQLISIPKSILTTTTKALKIRLLQKKVPPAALLLLTEETAINQLRPDNPAILALRSMRLKPRITSHSIIGDIGVLGARFCTDGVVAYKSAHLAGVKTQTIVPSNHDITDAPESIAQTIKILRSLK